MAKQTFTTGQVLTAAQLTNLQQTAMFGGAFSAKTSSYTAVAADAGTAISMTSTSATTITINSGLFAAGDTILITNLGSGACVITAGTATVNTAGSLSLSQYEAGLLHFVSASSAVFNDYVQAASNPLTTTGDMIYSSSGSTQARLGIGSTGQVLTVASGLPSWATPAGGGGMTLINSGGTALTGSSVTVSSIPGTYKHLLIIGKDVYASGTTDFIYQLNGDTGNNYTRRYVWFTTTCLSGNDTGQANAMIAATGTGSAYNTTTKFAMNIYRYAETEYKFMDVHSTANNSSKQDGWHINNWNNTAAITSITFLVSSGSFSGGTIYIYGVN